MTIVTDKAPTYPAIVKAMDAHAYTNQPIKHIDSKWYNNRIESDHASLKRITDPSRGSRSLRTAKATLHGVEAFRSIKQGHLHESILSVAGEIQLVNRLFAL